MTESTVAHAPATSTVDEPATAGQPGPRDRDRAVRAIEEFLRAMGHEPVGDLAETGVRVAEAWDTELLSGQDVDVHALLADGSIPLGAPGGAPDAVDVVGLRGIDVASMCPHHLLPSHGTAAIAYVPRARIAGLGVIARVVDACSRRLILQEDLGRAIAQAIVDGLGARAAICRLDMAHTCLVARGERKASARVETLSLAGSGPTEDFDRQVLLAWLGARSHTA